MPLSSGTKLGPYEILSSLGAGGMGEVYRARDTRLDRDVAIKVLPEVFLRDKERMLRLEREAKLLASLNHPQIAAIYGFEEHEGRRFLVMELAEGETLAARLARGPLSVDDALQIARQTAEALESAHEKGVIHRDLKPANLKVSADGVVKVLDFGLAKAMDAEASLSSLSDSERRGSSPSPADIAQSPTITANYTQPGVILGTAAYMSPEQARGRRVDKRTDIWAFGVVLYECLVGRRPFQGETTSDMIARILEREPDWAVLPRDTPPLVQLLLRRCLAKDRNRCLRDIGDARVDLETALTDPTSSGLLLAGAALASGTRRRARGAMLAAVVLVPALLLSAVFGWSLRSSRESVSAARVVRFNVEAPTPWAFGINEGSSLGSFSLNRSGTMLAFTAFDAGRSRILVRDFSESEARALPGTEGGSTPFFSPDGRWVGFLAGDKLMKVPVGGGPALTICHATGRDAVWLDDGTIVLETPGGTSLVRVAEHGGSPTELAVAGQSRRSVDGKQLLLGFQTLRDVPEADYILAGVWDGTTTEDYAIVAVSLADGAVRLVMPDGVDPYYVAPGHLVFLRGSSVLAAPFDVRRGVVIGEPVQMIDGVVASKWADQGLFYGFRQRRPGLCPGGRQGPGRRLIRVDAAGKSEPLMDSPDAIVGGLRVSPDGRDLILITLRRNLDLWSFDLSRRALALVNNVGETWSPVWTPDGESIVFSQTIPEKPRGVARKRADGSGEAEPVPIESKEEAVPKSFSPDGTLMLMTLENVSPECRSDIALYRWGQAGPAEIVLGTASDESGAMFAPDGKHFAYISNETGRYEVFVRPLSDVGAKWQISQAGGHEPVWSRDGKKLFFLDFKDVMHTVSVDLEAGPTFSAPQKLFDTAGLATVDLWGTYDVLPDGGFVMVQPADWEKERPRIHVVLNWQEELKRR